MSNSFASHHTKAGTSSLRVVPAWLDAATVSYYLPHAKPKSTPRQVLEPLHWEVGRLWPPQAPKCVAVLAQLCKLSSCSAYIANNMQSAAVHFEFPVGEYC